MVKYTLLPWKYFLWVLVFLIPSVVILIMKRLLIFSAGLWGELVGAACQEAKKQYCCLLNKTTNMEHTGQTNIDSFEKNVLKTPSMFKIFLFSYKCLTFWMALICCPVIRSGYTRGWVSGPIWSFKSKWRRAVLSGASVTVLNLLHFSQVVQKISKIKESPGVFNAECSRTLFVGKKKNRNRHRQNLWKKQTDPRFTAMSIIFLTQKTGSVL